MNGEVTGSKFKVTDAPFDATRFPGGDLITAGLADLEAGIESIPALLVAIGAPRLAALGLSIPAGPTNPEHRLYELLAHEDPDSAHARYNGFIRRLVSFERALACVG
jgi:hypothetical protein